MGHFLVLIHLFRLLQDVIKYKHLFKAKNVSRAESLGVTSSVMGQVYDDV